MKNHVFFRVAIIGALALCLGLMIPSALMAQDTNQLAQDANSALRQSQRSMFNGKLDESARELQKAAELIDQIEATDSAFGQLSTLRNKFNKQRKDLERRRPPDERTSEPTPEPSAPASARPAPVAAEKPTDPAPKPRAAIADPVEGVDLDALAKDADNAIKAAQRAMFSGKLDEAKSQMDSAADRIADIKAVDSDFAKLEGLESKFDKLHADLRRRLPETPREKVARLLEGNSGTLASAMEVLGAENASQDAVNEGERLIDFAANDIDAVLQEAGDAVPSDLPAIVAIQEQLVAAREQLEARKASLGAKAEQAAAQDAEKEKLADEWLQQLKVYLTGDKELIGGGTQNVRDLLHRKALYDEAKSLFDTYRETAFPLGKTAELELAEKDLAYRLDAFEQGYGNTLDSFAEAAIEQLGYAEEWLSEQEAKIAADPNVFVPYLSQDVIARSESEIVALEAASQGSDSRIGGFRERLASVQERGQALRQRGIELTVMLPDKFKGAEADAIKAKAAEILAEEHGDADPLRTTVIDDDWTQTQGWEYTDTTNSVLRYRVTRGVTVQIAAKRGGDVFLYSIHVAKDKQSDDSWGGMYGHVMFTDPMLEKNVKK